MPKTWRELAVAAIALMVAGTGNCGTEGKSATAPAAAKTYLDLFSFETDYIGSSSVRELGGRFGSQDALSNHFTYGHRFLLSGQWYFRAGLEYNRYDFGGAQPPLPSKLQSLAGVVAVEYVVENFAGAALELHPGLFCAENIRGNQCFDIPWDAYAGFTIRKDKLYGTLGASGAQFYSIPVIPIVGVIWLLRDDLRVEALFPRSSLIYTLSDHWELNVNWDLSGGGFRAGDTADPRLTNSVVEYYENRAVAQLTYSGWKPFKLIAGAGWCFGRTYDYFRAHEKFTTEGAPFLKIGVTANF